jgi:polyisoprenoid-binding protein YceI
MSGVRALAAAALLAAAPAAASNWAVVPAQSSIGFAAEWNGQAVQGRFERFTAAIRFDPKALTAAQVDAVIDLSSATTPDRTVNGALPGDDWFATGQSRQARFRSTAIVAGRTPNSYVARGTLTLRGASVPVELPFTLAINGDVATMNGTTRLDRRAFRIGMNSDAQGSWVGFAVPVSVRIVARRAK